MTNGNDLANPSHWKEGNDEDKTPIIDATQRGLTKREHFANNCPSEIPEWFDIDFEFPPNTVKSVYDKSLWDNEEDRKLCENWQKDSCYDLPKNLKWFQDSYEKYSDELHEARKQKVKQRYFSWRTYYADNLINALNK